MFCQNCGTKTEEGAQFCQSCGKATSGTAQVVSSPVSASNSTEIKSEAIVKCGNCEYIGPGEPARSMWATVLAWICVVFAWPITVLYFAVTHKYRCPKCKSTFLGVRNKDGVFAGKGGRNPVMILVSILLGVAIIGILASVVLASLNAAREKAKHAQEQSYQQLR